MGVSHRSRQFPWGHRSERRERFGSQFSKLGAHVTQLYAAGRTGSISREARSSHHLAGANSTYGHGARAGSDEMSPDAYPFDELGQIEDPKDRRKQIDRTRTVLLLRI